VNAIDEQKYKDGSQAVLYQKKIQVVHVGASIQSLIEFCIKVREIDCVGLLYDVADLALYIQHRG
jgi:hypothetical protein